MNSFAKFFKDEETRFVNWVVLLTGLWSFLIPFGKGEQVPVAALAAMGVAILIKNRRNVLRNPAAKGFLILTALYLVPVLISMVDAPSLKYPGRVVLTGVISALAGIAVITAVERDSRTLKRITAVVAGVVAFWLIDAGMQALTGYDAFGKIREADHLSGPWRTKTQMGYYFGPFSAFLFMVALKKNLKPILLWILFIAASIIVLLNNCRGGWVMYGVVASVFTWKAFIAPRKHKVAVCALLISIFSAVLAGLYFGSEHFRTRADQTLLVFKGDKDSINDALTFRVPIWTAAWEGIKDHPVNGHGARNFRTTGGDYWPEGYDDDQFNLSYPHQYLLEYAYGTGMIGMIGLIASFVLCIRWWIAAGPEQKNNAAVYGLTLLSLYFPLNSQKAHFSAELAVSLWILIACYTSGVFANRSEKKPDQLPASANKAIICLILFSMIILRIINSPWSPSDKLIGKWCRTEHPIEHTVVFFRGGKLNWERLDTETGILRYGAGSWHLQKEKEQFYLELKPDHSPGKALSGELRFEGFDGRELFITDSQGLVHPYTRTF